ncbi:MAG: response regulator [Limisphaerales bacterium]
MSRKRVLLVDDHPLLRSGVAALIENDPEFLVCGQVAQAREITETIRSSQADIVILDISLQGENGLEILKKIRTELPKTAVLILSMHDETIYAPQALRAGALGYLSKQDAPEKILEALRKVAAGGIYVSPRMAGTLLRHTVTGRLRGVASPLEVLSDREMEVFTLIGKGLPTREIARQMSLSTKTVESHRANIKEKLQLKSSIELLRNAVQWVSSHAGSGNEQDPNKQDPS